MLGRLIDGRYQVRSRIARGGMATVYLATDLRLERRVAIKIMHGHLADDNTFKSRFVQEARSAARLAHPNVVNVFDQGQDADMAYLVMEYLPGITLRDLIKDYGRLTPEQTMDILTAVLSGLAAAHKAGIVHRDLKPENVLLADDGRIKLGDFGLARAASNNTATGQALLGTIAYLSPELVTRGVADARSDIYALGIMTYEMLTGEQPYVGEAPMQIAYQHANDTVPMPSATVPGSPAQFDDLVAWATARDPEDRPRDARVMLDRLLSGEPLGSPESGSVRGGAGATLASADQATTVLTNDAHAATMVLPGEYSDIADAETQIFGSTPLAAGAATAGSSGSEPPTEHGALLATKADKRKRRGYLLFVVILLVAALAGGTGWYFGVGPGSQVAVAKTVGLPQEKATQKLTALGFEVVPVKRTDPEIAPGTVIASDPSGGNAPKGSRITIFVSIGPKILQVPDVIGAPESDARAQLAEFSIGESIREFSTGAPLDTVMAVLDATGNPVGPELAERAPVTLLVSAGVIPDVAGQTVDEATATLDAVGLHAEAGERVFSDDFADGAVIMALAPSEAAVRVGDTLTLRISKGPDVVEVPNVITGQTIASARKQLEALGFVVTSNVPQFLEGAVVAGAQDVDAGKMAKRGSTISVNFY
ncbi:Stk1 family PASTA domain-containing Ser/Thr kinase [Glaciibacter psychrotolerans]|nr:Stk1 family PASTA domain-containing Ser/Thr kinase [Leifsonia psychrotolerans]